MVRMRWSAILGVAILGCGNASPGMDTAVRVDSSGVELVANGPEDRVLGWEFERVLALGGADDGPESFFNVLEAGVRFGPAGRIYVLDAGNHRVRVFDASGDHIRSIGREGGGPGEFRFPGSLTVDAWGSITVYDFGQRAWIRFDSSGAFLDQSPEPRAVTGPVHATSGGRVFAARHRDADTGEVDLAIYRAVPGDTTEMLRVSLPEPRSIMYQSCGVALSLPPFFAGSPAWDARAGRFVVAESPYYSARVFDASTEVRRVRRAIEPQEGTRERALRELGEGEDWQIGGRPCTVPPEEVIEQRGVAERIPLIDDVALAPDGWLWVRRQVVGEEAGPVDVFDETGEYVGTLSSDMPWPLDFAANDRFLALETNEFDVQRVVVYEVRRN